jgi:hypothetical protein
MLLPTLPYRQSNLEDLSIELAGLFQDTLFIVGNGFDLMHGVKSSYYNFRDTISPQHMIRFTLEQYIHKTDIWGDFENNLAYLDREMMMGVLDDWLQNFNVLDEDDDDFSAANFFMAPETATEPVHVLTQELPKQFRKWINTLRAGSIVRPLKSLISPEAYYINFNYTEFLETIYGVPKESIAYIHGDRRKKREQLVLGHGRNEDEVFEEWYQANKDKPEYQPIRYGRKGRKYRNDNPVYLAYFLKDESEGNWKSQTRYDAIDNTSRLIEEYYTNSAKKTSDVIKKYRSIFDGFGHIRRIVVIGHSLSDVDYPYFKEIIKNTDNPSWNFGWFDSRSLKSIKTFVEKMTIPEDKISVFQI